MVSLLHLAVINEEGVAFQSPHDGRDMLLTPEHSITIQNRLGALAQPDSDPRAISLHLHLPTASLIGTGRIR